MSFTRRAFMPAAGAAALLGARRAGAMGSRAGMSRAAAASGTQTKSGLMVGYTPFTQDLFIPEIATSLPPGTLSPTPAAIAAPAATVAPAITSAPAAFATPAASTTFAITATPFAVPSASGAIATGALPGARPPP